MDNEPSAAKTPDQVRRERDAFRAAVLALTRKRFSFTPEELAELQANRRSLTELIDEIEAQPPQAP
jgi:hypothetical protein